jgi:hypothetical protein
LPSLVKKNEQKKLEATERREDPQVKPDARVRKPTVKGGGSGELVWSGQAREKLTVSRWVRKPGLILCEG